MNANATFVRPALVYAGVAGATRLALLLAQAAYLRSLGDVQFGVYAFATLTEQILFTVVAYAFTNALGAKYAATNDKTDRANAVGTALVSVVIASAVLAVCWQFAAIWFSDAFLAKGADAQDLLRKLIASGAIVTKFERIEPSLNDIFIDQVGGQKAAGASV